MRIDGTNALVPSILIALVMSKVLETFYGIIDRTEFGFDSFVE